MHTIILFVLAFFARTLIRIHKPYIIGVTGTAGKTTITTHVSRFLSQHFGEKNVGFSRYHYNGEYGLPLTIIGMRSPGKNIFLWFWMCIVAIWRMYKPYPKYLVLEYGIDHPGEMDFLLSIAEPDIVVISPIESNHIEQFGSYESYRAEKLKILRTSGNNIVHESLRACIQKEAIYYGFGAMSDIDASHISIDIVGTHAVVHFGGGDYPLHIPAIGAFQIENILPLYPIAQKLHLDTQSITPYASGAHPESGRSNFLSGIGGSVIIDGSYNGGYMSIREGIRSIRSLLSGYHVILFLGDMRELGVQTQSLHEQLASDILDMIPPDGDVSLYLVGPSMAQYVAPKLEMRFPMEMSNSSRELGQRIHDHILSTTKPVLIYVKGSQNTIFLEEGIKMFLDPKEDTTRLTRQSKSWIAKKEVFFSKIKENI